MEERQKVEEIKREQMGHEGVVNALARRTGLCTCMCRERIFLQQMGTQIGRFILEAAECGTTGRLGKMNQQP